MDLDSSLRVVTQPYHTSPGAANVIFVELKYILISLAIFLTVLYIVLFVKRRLT